MEMISARALPFLALFSLGVVAYQQNRLGNFPPPPHAFVGVGLVFTVLSLMALASPQLAAAFGAAVVVWLVFAYHGVLQPTSGGSA